MEILHQAQHKKKEDGFTLVETVIYTVLIAVFMTGLVSFSLSLFGMYTKAKSMEEVLVTSKRMDSVFSYYIENIAESDVYSSNNGASSSLELVLKTGETIKIYLESGSAWLKTGSEEAHKLTSSEVVVSDLIIEDQSSDKAKSSYRISSKIRFFSSDSVEYQYEQNFLGVYNLNNEI